MSPFRAAVKIKANKTSNRNTATCHAAEVKLSPKYVSKMSSSLSGKEAVRNAGHLPGGLLRAESDWMQPLPTS